MNQQSGWYYALGDPPGTHRYWDGAQWQGGPQVVGYGSDPAESGAKRVAEPAQRFIAYLIDSLVFIPFYVLMIALAAGLGAVSETLGIIGFLIGILVAFGFLIYNILYLQGTTGQTIGKKQQGIVLLDSGTFQPIGIGSLFVRLILQAIFAIPCYLDHWWILVDEDNRRLSDKQLGYHVYKA